MVTLIVLLFLQRHTVPSRLFRSSAQTPVASSACQTTSCVKQSFTPKADQHIPIQQSLQPTINTSLTRSTFGAQNLIHFSSLSINPPILVSVLVYGSFFYFFSCAVYPDLVGFSATLKMSHEHFFKLLGFLLAPEQRLQTRNLSLLSTIRCKQNFDVFVPFCNLNLSQRRPDNCKE